MPDRHNHRKHIPRHLRPLQGAYIPRAVTAAPITERLAPPIGADDCSAETVAVVVKEGEVRGQWGEEEGGDGADEEEEGGEEVKCYGHTGVKVGFGEEGAGQGC